MEGVGETDLFGNLFDQRASLPERVGGQIHFQVMQVLVGALMVVTLEQTAKISLVHMTFSRDLLQGFEPLAVLLNVLTTMLVGAECQRPGAFQRSARILDFQGDTFEKSGAEFTRVPPLI